MQLLLAFFRENLACGFVDEWNNRDDLNLHQPPYELSSVDQNP
jgi:hypothetical protein